MTTKLELKLNISGQENATTTFNKVTEGLTGVNKSVTATEKNIDTLIAKFETLVGYIDKANASVGKMPKTGKGEGTPKTEKPGTDKPGSVAGEKPGKPEKPNKSVDAAAKAATQALQKQTDDYAKLMTVLEKFYERSAKLMDKDAAAKIALSEKVAQKKMREYDSFMGAEQKSLDKSQRAYEVQKLKEVNLAERAAQYKMRQQDRIMQAEISSQNRAAQENERSIMRQIAATERATQYKMRQQDRMAQAEYNSQTKAAQEYERNIAKQIAATERAVAAVEKAAVKKQLAEDRAAKRKTERESEKKISGQEKFSIGSAIKFEGANVVAQAMSSMLGNSIALSSAFNSLSSIGVKAFDALALSAGGVTFALGIAAAAIAAITVSTFAFAASAVSAASKYAEFETALTKVGTLMDYQTESIGAMGNAIQSMMIKYGKGAKEVGDAFYEGLSSGAVTATNSIVLMDVAIRASTAGFAQLSNVTNVLSGVINAYGLETTKYAHAADVLIISANEGQTNLEQLAAQLGDITGIAAAAKIPFEELAASVSAVTAAGMKTNVAVTGIRSAIMALMRPNKEMQMVLDSLKIKSISAALAQDGLFNTLRRVTNAVGNNVEAVTRMIGSQEAIVPVMNLMGTSAEKFEKTMNKMSAAGDNGSVGIEQMAKIAETAEFKISQADKQYTVAMENFGKNTVRATTLMKVAWYNSLEYVVTKFGDIYSAIEPYLDRLIAVIVSSATTLANAVKVIWGTIATSFYAVMEKIKAAWAKTLTTLGKGMVIVGGLGWKAAGEMGKKFLEAGYDIEKSAEEAKNARVEWQKYVDTVQSFDYTSMWNNTYITRQSQAIGEAQSVVEGYGKSMDNTANKIKRAMDMFSTPKLNMDAIFEQLKMERFQDMLTKGTSKFLARSDVNTGLSEKVTNQNRKSQEEITAGFLGIMNKFDEMGKRIQAVAKFIAGVPTNFAEKAREIEQAQKDLVVMGKEAEIELLKSLKVGYSSAQLNEIKKTSKEKIDMVTKARKDIEKGTARALAVAVAKDVEQINTEVAKAYEYLFMSPAEALERERKIIHADFDKFFINLGSNFMKNYGDLVDRLSEKTKEVELKIHLKYQITETQKLMNLLKTYQRTVWEGSNNVFSKAEFKIPLVFNFETKTKVEEVKKKLELARTAIDQIPLKFLPKEVEGNLRIFKKKRDTPDVGAGFTANDIKITKYIGMIQSFNDQLIELEKRAEEATLIIPIDDAHVQLMVEAVAAIQEITTALDLNNISKERAKELELSVIHETDIQIARKRYNELLALSNNEGAQVVQKFKELMEEYAKVATSFEKTNMAAIKPEFTREIIQEFNLLDTTIKGSETTFNNTITLYESAIENGGIAIGKSIDYIAGKWDWLKNKLGQGLPKTALELQTPAQLPAPAVNEQQFKTPKLESYTAETRPKTEIKAKNPAAEAMYSTMQTNWMKFATDFLKTKKFLESNMDLATAYIVDDFKKAWEKIVVLNEDGTVDTAKSAVKMTEEFDKASQDLVDRARDTGKLIGDYLNAGFDAIGAGSKGIMTAIFGKEGLGNTDYMKDSLKESREQLGKAWESWGKADIASTDTLSVAKSGGALIGQALGTGMMEALGAVGAIATIINFFNVPMLEFRKNIRDTLKDMMNIGERLAQNMPSFFEAVLRYLPDIVMNFVRAIPRMVVKLIESIIIGIVGLVVNLVKQFVDWFQKIGEEFVSQMWAKLWVHTRDFFRAIFEYIGLGITWVIAQIYRVVEIFYGMFDKNIKAGDFSRKVEEKLNNVGKQFGDALNLGMDDLFNKKRKFTRINIDDELISKQVSGAFNKGVGSDEFRVKDRESLNTAAVSIDLMGETLSSSILDSTEVATSSFTDMFSGLQEVSFNMFPEWLKDFGVALEKFASWAWGGISSILETLGKGLVKFAEWAWGGVGPALQTLGDGLVKFAAWAWGGVGDLLAKAFNAIVSWDWGGAIKAVAAALLQFAKWGWGTLIPVVAAALLKFANWGWGQLPTIATALLKFANWGWGYLGKFAGWLMEFLYKVGNVLKPFVDAIKSLLSPLKKAGAWIENTVVQPVTNAFSLQGEETQTKPTSFNLAGAGEVTQTSATGEKTTVTPGNNGIDDKIFNALFSALTPILDNSNAPGNTFYKAVNPQDRGDMNTVKDNSPTGMSESEQILRQSIGMIGGTAINAVPFGGVAYGAAQAATDPTNPDRQNFEALTSEMAKLTAAMGQQVTSVVGTEMINAANSPAAEAVSTAVETATKPAQTEAKKTGTGAMDYMAKYDPTKPFATKKKEGQGDLDKTLQDIWASAGNIAMLLQPALALAIKTAAIITLGPIAGFVIGVIKLAQRLMKVDWENVLEKIEKFLGKIKEKVIEAWKFLWGGVVQFFTEAIPQAAEWYKKHIWPYLKLVIDGVWNAIKQFFTEAVPQAAQWFMENIWPLLQTAWKFIWNGLVQFFTEALPQFGQWFLDSVWPGIQAVWKFIWNGIVRFFTEALPQFGQWFLDNVWPGIQAAWKFIWNGLVQFFTEALPQFAQWFVEKIWPSIQAAWKYIWGAISAGFEVAKEYALKAAHAIRDYILMPLWNGLKSIGDWIGKIPLVKWLRDAFERLWSGVKVVLNFFSKLFTGKLAFRIEDTEETKKKKDEQAAQENQQTQTTMQLAGYSDEEIAAQQKADDDRRKQQEASYKMQEDSNSAATEGAGVIGSAISSIFDGINKMGEAIVAAAVTVAELTKDLHKLLSILKPIGAAFDRVTGSIAKLGDWIKDVFLDTWDSLVEGFTTFGDWIINTFQLAWDTLTLAFSAFGDWIINTFQIAWNALTLAFTVFGDWITNIFMIAWAAMTAAFTVFGDWITNIFMVAWGTLTLSFTTFGDWITNVFMIAWNALTLAFTAFGDWITNIFSVAWALFIAPFTAFGDWISTTLIPAVTGIATAFSSFSGILALFQPLIDGVRGAFEWMSTLTLPDFKTAWDNVVGFLTSFAEAPAKMGEAISGMITMVGDKIASTFKDIYNGMVDFVNGLKIGPFNVNMGFPGSWDEFKIPVIDFIPEMTRMAKGGYVGGGPSGTDDNISNDSYPTMLSKGEYVLPRSVAGDAGAMGRIKGAVAGGGAGGESNITINISVAPNSTVTEAELRKKLIPEILNAIRKESQSGRQVISTKGIY